MNFNLDDKAMNEIMDIFREFDKTATSGLNQAIDLARKFSDVFKNSERRTLFRSLNSEINGAKQEFIWLPNDDGILFGHLADRNRDPRVENIPVNIDDIRNADINTIDAIMTIYFKQNKRLLLNRNYQKSFDFLDFIFIDLN